MEDIIIIADQLNKGLTSLHLDTAVEVIISLIIIMLLFKGTDIMDIRLKDKINQGGLNSPLLRFLPLLNKIVKGLILFFVIASFLQSHGYSVQSLVAGFGITGLAVGFAAKEAIANIFGSIAVLSDRVFEIGDYVKVSGVEGTVEVINLRSTKIRTLENELVTIPNNVVANAVVTNVTSAQKKRINEVFAVTYDTSDEKLKHAVEIIENIAKNHPEIYNDYIVYVETLADSSINIRFTAYVKTNNINKLRKVREQIILETIKQYRAEGIDFAFPSRTLYMAHEN